MPLRRTYVHSRTCSMMLSSRRTIFGLHELQQTMAANSISVQRVVRSGSSNINVQRTEEPCRYPFRPLRSSSAFADRAVQALSELEGQSGRWPPSQAGQAFQSLLAGVFGEGA